MRRTRSPCGARATSGHAAAAPPRNAMASRRLMAVGSGAGCCARSLRHGHQFEYVTVRVFEIESAPAAPIVQLAVVEAPRRAAIGEALLLDAAEDGVEFLLADVKRVVVTVEF